MAKDDFLIVSFPKWFTSMSLYLLRDVRKLLLALVAFRAGAFVLPCCWSPGVHAQPGLPSPPLAQTLRS